MTRYKLPDGRTFWTHEDFYLASCDHCGWVGSTEKCGTDVNTDAGDSNIYCPKCHASGADVGKIAATAVEIAP